MADERHEISHRTVVTPQGRIVFVARDSQGTCHGSCAFGTVKVGGLAGKDPSWQLLLNNAIDRHKGIADRPGSQRRRALVQYKGPMVYGLLPRTRLNLRVKQPLSEFLGQRIAVFIALFLIKGCNHCITSPADAVPQRRKLGLNHQHQPLKICIALARSSNSANDPSKVFAQVQPCFSLISIFKALQYSGCRWRRFSANEATNAR